MTLAIKYHQSILDFTTQQWNDLAGEDYPFLRHEFLAALELSQCTCTETGWQAMHIGLYNNDVLIAVMPTYQKSHSYGEYVFDWAWADAYQQNGLAYYPKLLTAIPFSPCYGPRIATRQPLEELLPSLIQGIKQLCDHYDFSSWHGLFIPPEQLKAYNRDNLSIRTGVQYHWHNKNYDSFEHYLSHFTSRKRKNINKERKKIREQNIEIIAVEGADISQNLLEKFYHCYHLTYLKRGRKGYLNFAFFQHLLETIPQHIVLFTALHNNEVVACAFCFKNNSLSQSTLFGRYWGCLDNFDSLHFETCYYKGLEYCIEHKIQRFDPGAQGEHKIQRGFEPIETYSVHYIKHGGFAQAIENFVVEETESIKDYSENLKQHLPFKEDL